MSDLRRLYRLARLISIDELDPAAFTLEEASLVEVLLAEHSRLLADRDDLNLVAERTTISVRRSTWLVGSDVTEEDAALVRGAAPNHESAARICAAFARPVVGLIGSRSRASTPGCATSRPNS